MGQRGKARVTADSASEQEMRDQEVLRANRELAAYFKGRRTEREARSALKIIKAFVRDRERRNAGSRTPLPGREVGKMSETSGNRRAAHETGERHRPRRRRRPQEKASKSVAASIESPVTLAPAEVPSTRE